MEGSGGETAEKYQLMIDEMEKKLTDESLGMVKFAEEKKMVAERIQDLRDKYNALVEQKIKLQKDLLTSEEEKINLSKALIEMQIDKAKLVENLKAAQFEGQTKNVVDEAGSLETQLTQEKLQKSLAELQENFTKNEEEKKSSK